MGVSGFRDAGTIKFMVKEITKTIPKITYFDSSSEKIQTEKNVPLWTTVKGVSYTLNVLDSAQEFKKWQKEVLAQVTDSGMDKFEKVRAIRNFIETHSYYRAIRYNGKRYAVGSWENQLTWLVGAGEWIKEAQNGLYLNESYTSPALLASFGKLIGMPELRSMYYDYPQGSAKWQGWHYTVTDDKGFYCSVCPKGDVTFDPAKDKKVDFSQYK